MKFPLFPVKARSAKLNKEEEQIFAEASELAMMRLEQCIADMQVTMPAMREALRRYEHSSLRRFTNLF